MLYFPLKPTVYGVPISTQAFLIISDKNSLKTGNLSLFDGGPGRI